MSSVRESLNQSVQRSRNQPSKRPGTPMTQPGIPGAAYAGKREQTRRENFLAGMGRVVPWEVLPALIDPAYC